MEKEVADKWLEALRSGKYEQAKGQLARHGKYCCLGVLCDISKKGEWVPIGGYRVGAPHTGHVSTTELPPEVRDWAGMKSVGGELLDRPKMARNNARSAGPEEAHNLMQCNDWGLSFKEIADIIEKQWRTL